MIKSPQTLSTSRPVFGGAFDIKTVSRSQITEIAGRCHNTNRAIQTAEDARLIQLRKTRLALKHAIAAALRDG